MKHVFIAVALGLFVRPGLAQTTYAVQDTAYIRVVEQALVYLKKGDCQPCLDSYRKAFAISQKSALSTMRAALCAYQCTQTEQARAFLNKATSLDWWACEDMWNKPKEYPEFDILRASVLATDFHNLIDKQKVMEGRNPALERELEQIFKADNLPRLRLDTLGRKYGFKSSQTQSLWEQIRQADSVNLLKVQRIIEHYGYPGKRLVGEKQNETTWLVIQHAPLPVQEKYLPLMQEAARQGQLSKASVALLEDRIHVRKGEKQLYGSQVHADADGKPDGFHPIEDEANVNKRRVDIGLEPIENYARRFGFEYKPVGK